MAHNKNIMLMLNKIFKKNFQIAVTLTENKKFNYLNKKFLINYFKIN